MKKSIKIVCSIICILAMVILPNQYGVCTAVTAKDYIEVDYRDLCSSSLLTANTISRASSGKASASSDVYSKNFEYELLSGEIVSFSLYCRLSSNLIFTPNGTDAGVSGSTMYTCTYLNDIPDRVKEDLNSKLNGFFPSAELLSQPTTKYNCHSYAWYSQNVATNSVWLGYPNIYYSASDLSYQRVYNPRAGDIICYFDLDENSEIQNVHSGIIVGSSGETSNGVCGDANRFIVKSKWGMNGLYTHKGDVCPYTSAYGGPADEVRYYRPRINGSYNLSASMSSRTISRTISTGNSITSKYGMYELNITDAGRYTFTISSDDGLDNRLYNVHMNQVQLTSLTPGVGTYTYDLYMSAGTYYLRTAYTDLTNSGTIRITMEPHTHNYNRWTYYSNVAHIESCCCGRFGTVTKGHSIKESEIVNRKANCLGCGHLLNLNSDIAQITPDRIRQISANGSYILPNGIIVLVDEDVEAYLNGTLVFYDCNDIPVSE